MIVVPWLANRWQLQVAHCRLGLVYIGYVDRLIGIDGEEGFSCSLESIASDSGGFLFSFASRKLVSISSGLRNCCLGVDDNLEII